MKISIITISLNSEKTIMDTINSVQSQSYNNIEHIIIDGGSTDKTISIINNGSNSKLKLYKKKGFGIYKSFNYGIKQSTGKYIIILNSDDIFHNNNVITNLTNIIKKNKKTEIFLGNVVYFKGYDYSNIKRFYSSLNFKRWKMILGNMPPHPGSIIKKDIYIKYGLYSENFKIAGDFEYFLRLFYIKKIKYKILDKTIIRMRLGGISTKNIFSYIVSTKEILESFRLNKVYSNFFLITLRLPGKFFQYFNIENKNLDKDYELFKLHKNKDYYYQNSFKIFKNINKIKYLRNFILSGMNLAFLGYYVKKSVYPMKNLYHWPDGIWAKRHIKVEKLPGRNLLNQIKFSKKNINKILVLGNLSKKSFNFLKNKFKIKIINKKLPYGSIETIQKKIIKFDKKTLVLITLPTPKQEQLAYNLAKKNKFYKIICIGASVAIASGEEMAVPKILSKFEFIWRLRSDFFRRITRMIETLLYYLKGKFKDGKIDGIRFLEIE
jgi:glycosyltransferase involved in cell wall biosynthesis